MKEAPKPGYKTSEFWCTVAASFVSLLFASGAMDQTATTIDDQVLGLAAFVLTTLGYQVTRALAKRPPTEK